jgi:hypothetical protein
LSRTIVVALVLTSSAAFAQDSQTQPILRGVRIDGASVYSAEEITARQRLVLGAPLPRRPEVIAREIADDYHDDGFTLASASASLDEASGTLTVQIDEGAFDAIEVEGLREQARNRIREDLALQPGVFNARQANRALDEALSFAQGAIMRGQPTFTIVNEAGRRVLRIALATRGGQGGVFAGTLGREDWYSPVDALNFGLGVQSTIFDQRRFNHAYWAGHVTYKFGPERLGYSLGFEKPFFGDAVLQVGASIHDLTASDDQWRLGDLEQSLVAVTFRNTFRDYYRRKGYQLHAAVRPAGEHEFLIAWRDDSHAALRNETNYGFFRDSHGFRENQQAAAGDMRAVIVGYTFDTRGLGRQFAPERYRRHLLDDLFGDVAERRHGVRIDWRSELAPASLDHDFDFTRHIANVRGWWQASRRRIISGRALFGTSTGALPPQRELAVGGIGSVRGYGFKDAVGDRMLLLNAELRQDLGWGNTNTAGLVFFDAGRVFNPRPDSSEAWMRGVGVGIEFGQRGPRVEFGWRLDDIPSSLQVLFRLRPTF